MFSSSWSLCRLFTRALCLLVLLTQVSAVEMDYCSDINTADTPKNSSIYQSNGLCTGFCNQNYAFAVLQYDGCWCSDYIPPSTTDDCNRECPGYGFESCGGMTAYGYIQLQKEPAGTQGVKAPPSTTAQVTTTVTERPNPVTSTISSTTQRSETTTESSRQSSSTWTPTPSISLETVTGQVRTITVTPTAPPDSQNANLFPQGQSSGLGIGGAVGLTVGLVALIAIVCSILYFCMRKRRQQREVDDGEVSRESEKSVGGPIPSRTMSENSRYVLGTDGRQVVETWENDNRDAPGSRKSRLMPVDPRLDPFSSVYQRGGENKSRESVNTIRDDHDYSRRVQPQHNGPILRATNPD